MSTRNVCYNCGSQEMEIFYKREGVPIHSVLLLQTQIEAINYPKGNIVLAFCPNCGFISNIAFDSHLQEYSSRYEGTQSFSPIFDSFHKNLAMRLIEQYDLRNKNIIEIGCGQGEFLTLLCQLGGNRGVGFDPAYTGRANKIQKKDQITFIKDFYSEKYANYQADFICCKMTLEHIQRTASFVSTIHQSITNQKETIVFFQVPDTGRILRDLAFWDIYYEHCSYFSSESLAYLFHNSGFNVLDLWRAYNNQYLMIAAKPGNRQKNSSFIKKENLSDLRLNVAYFAQNYHHKLNEWRQRLNEIKKSKKRAVIWGAGSKGVAFMTSLRIQDEIKYAVDINPHKHDTFMAGTGHQIVKPDFLREFSPDVVIVMNSIYYNEIRQELKRLNVSAEVITV